MWEEGWGFPFVLETRMSLNSKIALTILAMGVGIPIDTNRKTEPTQRLCLNCGKPKTHNNSFCSAECCIQYRKRDSR
jgi:hypothetical protein